MKIAALIAQYLSALGTIAIGAVVAYIAWRQYRTSHDRFRLDLFEKRYDVYRALMKFLRGLAPDTSKTGEQIMAFRADTNDARFLFGPEVVDFLSEIYSKSWQYRRTIHRLSDRNPTDHEKYKQWANDEAELLRWFDDQMKRVNEVFAPYLSFKDKSIQL